MTGDENLKNIWITIFLVAISFLAGCTNEQTFEGFFQKEMEDVNYPYSLIYEEKGIVHDDDAIAIFKEYNSRGEQIFIAYFEKSNGRWNWLGTRGAEWGDPVNWSSMNERPFIYSGAILNENILGVYAGEHKAKIITVEGNKRFWYAISNQNDVNVKYIMSDGKEKIVESIDWDEVKK